MLFSLLLVVFSIVLATRPTIGFPATGEPALDLENRALSPPLDEELDDFDLFPENRTFHRAHSLSKRGKASGKIIRQSDPEIEMKFISQAEGSKIDYLEDFAYLDYAGSGSGGSGTTVYVHDSGINLEHTEFQAKRPGVQKPNIKRIIPKKTFMGNEFSQTKADTDGHGTCVASKVVGKLFGVAKGASLKMVYRGNGTHEQGVTGLQYIVDDIKRKKKQWGKRKGFFPIVNLSYALRSDIETDHRDYLAKYRKRYLEMVQEGALLVATAGNDGPNVPIRYPAKFAEEDEFKDNMLVVGGVDIEGEIWRDSQRSPLVEAWAPAVVRGAGHPQGWMGISCAWIDSNDDVTAEIGTSFAAPQVAGLAAYFHSSYPELRGDRAAKKIKDKIIESSFPRTEGGPDCIWNLQHGTNSCPE